MNSLTTPGLALFATAQSTQSTVNIDKFVYADITGLTSNPIDPNMVMPTEPQLVHTQGISQVGVVNTNMVVYSDIVLSSVPQFDYNFIGVADYNNVIIGGLWVPRRTKSAGNTLVSNFALEYSNIKSLTTVDTLAESWQLDNMLLFRGVEDRQTLLAKDMFGSLFFDNAFKVEQDTSLHKVLAGIGYVEGVRVSIDTEINVVDFGPFPTSIFVDATIKPTISGYETTAVLVSSVADVPNYVDGEGFNHYVLKVADIAGDETVADLRTALPTGAVLDNAVQPTGTYPALRAQATTKEDVGLSNIPNVVSGSVVSTATDVLANSLAVKTAYDKGQEGVATALALTYTDVGAPALVHDHNADYYTQLQVDTQIANLVNAAPTTLDTLNELAAALGDDPNFATTVSTQIGGKADIGHTHTAVSLGVNTIAEVDAKVASGIQISDANVKFGFFAEADLNTFIAGAVKGVHTLAGSEKIVNLDTASASFGTTYTVQSSGVPILLDAYVGGNLLFSVIHKTDTCAAATYLVYKNTNNENDLAVTGYRDTSGIRYYGEGVFKTAEARLDEMGTLTDLNTTDQSNLVAAINEVRSSGAAIGVEANTPSTVVQRDAIGDITARLLRSEYVVDAGSIPAGSALSYRVEEGTAPADNYVRFADLDTVKAFLGITNVVTTDVDAVVTAEHAFTQAPTGGYISGTDVATWGGGIWGIGKDFNGSANGIGFDKTGMYGMAWIRPAHPLYNAYIGEGMYVIVAGVVVGGIGDKGVWSSGTVSQQ